MKLDKFTNQTNHLLQEVTNYAHIDYRLTVTNLTTDERKDIAPRSVWIRGQCAYFNVRIFNPLVRTYRDHCTENLQLKRKGKEVTLQRTYSAD